MSRSATPPGRVPVRRSLASRVLAVFVAAAVVPATALADEGDEAPTTEAPATTEAPPTTEAPEGPSTTVTTVAAEAPPTTEAPSTTVAAEIRPTTEGIDVNALPRELQDVLATIRYVESRHTYDVRVEPSTASGAYQFIDSAWDGFGGYPAAHLAPPAVQDEKALLYVQQILRRFHGDVSMVPLMWYFPAVVRQPHLMDVVPKPEHGNTLTLRQYQMRWLSVYAGISGIQLAPAPAVETAMPGDVGPSTASTPPAADRPEADGDAAGTSSLDDLHRRRGTPPRVAVTPRGMALTFPVLGPSRLAGLDCSDDATAVGLCDPAAPGVVFGVKLQPVLAAADGVVTAVDDQPGGGRPISVVVTSANGISIEYRGFNDDRPGTDDGAAPDHLRLTELATTGTVVRAGQVLGFMGDSDPLPPSVRADVPTDASQRLDPAVTAPHIRLTITDAAGRAADAVAPLLDAQGRESCRVGIGGWSMPAAPAAVAPVTIETTDQHREIDSEWTITETGQVLASGWAAMIHPTELCSWVPADAFGPGAAGSVDWPEHWLAPYELPTRMWVELALRDDAMPEALVLPG